MLFGMPATIHAKSLIKRKSDLETALTALVYYLFIYLFNLHNQTWFYVSVLRIDQLNQLFHHTVLPVDAPPSDSSNPLPLLLVDVVDPGGHPPPESQPTSPLVCLALTLIHTLLFGKVM